MKKSIMLLIFSVIWVFLLIGCGDTNPQDNDADQPDPSIDIESQIHEQDQGQLQAASPTPNLPSTEASLGMTEDFVSVMADINYQAERTHREIARFDFPSASERNDILVLGDSLLISDTDNHRLILMDKNGNILSYIGSRGSEQGYFREPRGLTQDEHGNVYVVDSWNFRIQKFDPNLVFIEEIDLVFARNIMESMEEFTGSSLVNSIAIYDDNIYLSIDSMQRDHSRVYILDRNGNLTRSEANRIGFLDTNLDSGEVYFLNMLTHDVENRTPSENSLGRRGTGNSMMYFMNDTEITKQVVFDRQLAPLNAMNYDGSMYIVTKGFAGIIRMNPNDFTGELIFTINMPVNATFPNMGRAAMDEDGTFYIIDAADKQIVKVGTQ